MTCAVGVSTALLCLVVLSIDGCVSSVNHDLRKEHA